MSESHTPARGDATSDSRARYHSVGGHRGHPRSADRPAASGRDREHEDGRLVRRSVLGMAARHRATDEDRQKAIEIALRGVSAGDELTDIAARLAPLHPRNDTFPGEVLLDLAADAIELSGASRQHPIEFEGIRDRYLPEGVAHTKAQHRKSEFALRASAMLHGGVDPALLDEVRWWQSDDLWYWSLEALVVYVRAAADRADQSVESVCRQIADVRGISVAD